MLCLFLICSQSSDYFSLIPLYSDRYQEDRHVSKLHFEIFAISFYQRTCYVFLLNRMHRTYRVFQNKCINKYFNSDLLITLIRSFLIFMDPVDA